MSPARWLLVAVGAVCFLTLAAFPLFFRVFHIPTGSMIPTVQRGERVLVWKTKNVRRGDVVACHFSRGAAHMYRLVAAGGDVVEIRDKQLFVNGARVHEPYVRHEFDEIYPKSDRLPEPYRSRDQLGPLKIPSGHFFALGDNRDLANDSRYQGTVPRENVIGRVVAVYSLGGVRRLRRSSVE